MTELEGAVLGVVWTEGPLTTYGIRSTFLKSRSSHFSGSAGAIYPLVERLEEAGLLQSTRHKRGSRESHHLSITTAGKQALRQWLSQENNDVAAVEFDPIRARVHFLGILTPRQRAGFLRKNIVLLEQEIRETELLIEHRRKLGNKWHVYGAMGALRTLQARLAWLDHILESE